MGEEGLQRGGLVLANTVGELVMPGDQFRHPGDLPKLVLGPGLKLLPPPRTTSPNDQKGGGSGGRIVATKPGVLRTLKGHTFFVEMKAKQVGAPTR